MAGAPRNDRVEACHCEPRLLPTASGGEPSNSGAISPDCGDAGEVTPTNTR